MQTLKQKAALQLLARRKARESLHAYIEYTSPNYLGGWFSQTVCSTIDKFLVDVHAGKRPVLILAAPPQHGKSEIVSRKLPSYILGRWPNMRIGAASYADSLAASMAQSVRRNLASAEHRILFPTPNVKDRYAIDRMGEFNAPGGTGSYIGVGVGAGLTGRPVDIAIVDDPIKNAKESLSVTTKAAVWDWYSTVLKTRLSERSGQIIMATAWAQDDLQSRIEALHQGDPRLTVLRFPAINLPDEVGFDPSMPLGALVPKLHSLQKLQETKAETSDYWWAALYQQRPKALGGNVFKEEFMRVWLPKDLPTRFDKLIASVDATFKDTDGTDYVVIQVWGKVGANSYLLDQVRGRLSFTATLQMLVKTKDRWPDIREVLIEDKANGPAIIDTLKGQMPGLIPIEPDGSKLARAHAVTWVWEAGNVWIPHISTHVWVKGFIDEIVGFPASANDDRVDAMTQALRRLYPLRGTMRISPEALEKVL